MTRIPTALGLTLAEQVVVEEGTHNLTLVNYFRRLRLAHFPSTPRPFTAFAALIGGSGQITLDLVVHRLDSWEEIHAQSRTVQFTDPLRETWVLFRVTRCSFPEPGSFQFSLLANQEIIAQRLLTIVAMEHPS